MNRSLFVLTLLSSCSVISLEKTAKSNKLQLKPPTRTDWQQFEQQNLDHYTQEEIAPFLFAAVNQKAPLTVVKKILDEKELSVNTRDTNGNLILVQAILSQNTECTILLLRRNAKVVFEMDRPCYSGSYDDHSSALTPWQAACITGQEKYARLVYEKMEPKDQQWVRKGRMYLLKHFPIDYALIHKKQELAHYLVSLDPDLLTQNYDYQRAANATSFPNAIFLKKMYEQIPLFLDADKDKLLSLAVQSGNFEGTKLLVEKGAQADVKMCADAAVQENKALLDELCKTGVKLNGAQALRECLWSGQLKSVTPITLLLQAGATIEDHQQADTHSSYDYKQPLILLIANAHINLPLKKSLVQLLRQQGIKLDTQNKAECTLLHETCGRNFATKADAEFMFYLLDLGANADLPDVNGQTAFLQFCASNRSAQKLQRFLQTYNPAINVSDKQGNTALIHAAQQGKKSRALIALLISHGANISQSKNQMLQAACETLNSELASELIETHSASVAHTNAQGQSILMSVIKAHNFAHKKGKMVNSEKITRARLELIDLVTTHGVQVNAQDRQGKTALHCAAQENRPCIQTLQKLLSLGANPSICDQDNKTPLEFLITASAYYADINQVELLLNHLKGKPIILSTGQTPIEYALSLNKTTMFDNQTPSWKAKLLDLFTQRAI